MTNGEARGARSRRATLPLHEQLKPLEELLPDHLTMPPRPGGQFDVGPRLPLALADVDVVDLAAAEALHRDLGEAQVVQHDVAHCVHRSAEPALDRAQGLLAKGSSLDR